VKKRYRMVLVKWQDAVGESEYWQDEKRLNTSTGKILTIGFLVHKDKESVVLAQSIDLAGSFGGIHIIPRGMVDEITEP
jgi:hypothetical protein